MTEFNDRRSEPEPSAPPKYTGPRGMHQHVASHPDGDHLYQHRNIRMGGSDFRIIKADGTETGWTDFTGRTKPKPPPGGGRWRWTPEGRDLNGSMS